MNYEIIYERDDEVSSYLITDKSKTKYYYFEVTSTAELKGDEHRVRISNRNQGIDNFKYEKVILNILKGLEVNNISLNLQIFEKINDFELFDVFVFLINQHFKQDIIVERRASIIKYLIRKSCLLNHFIKIQQS